MSGTQSPEAVPIRNLQKHSCVTCSKRKVKCDRKVPCTNCERMQSECEYKDPAPPRRRKKRPPEEDLLDRCRRYEEMLKSYGADVDAPLGGDGDSDARRASQGGLSSSGKHDANDDNSREPSSTNGPSASQTRPDGKLIVDQGKSRFLDNPLWESISQEFQNPNELLMDSESSDDEESEVVRQRPIELSQAYEEDIILGSAPKITNISALHPDPPTMRRLWAIYLTNVDPLIKITHVPTTEALIFEAAKDISSISRSTEALLFAIYACATTSMDDEGCRKEFGQEKKRYLTRWLGASRLALANSRLLRTSEFMVLQAFVLYLVAGRPLFDTRSLWTVTGTAVRIGQRIGLDRDAAEYGLGPFEVEMRQRLWWQITWMDARAAQHSGAALAPSQPLWDIKCPLNVNDSDLYPGMEKEPQERQGATEMMFCLLRFEMAKFFREVKAKWTFNGNWRRTNKALATMEEKGKLIDQLEASIEEKFLRYCDPLVPLHLISTIIARSALCILRTLAHHPRLRREGDAFLTDEEKDIRFTNSLKALEYDNLAQATASTRHFLWHTHTYFQWPAMIVVLDTLQTRTSGDDIDRAWRQMEDVYRHHSELSGGTGNAMYIACGNMTLRAWEARAAAHPHPPSSSSTTTSSSLPTPDFVTQLYTRRDRLARKFASREYSDSTPNSSSLMTDRSSMPATVAPLPNTLQPVVSHWATSEDLGSIPQEFSFAQSPIDWNEWDNILQGFQVPDFAVQDKGFGEYS